MDANQVGRLAVELATELRDLVAPRLGAHDGRGHSSTGAGGDITFAIDAEAESYLERFMSERAGELAFYSEDLGLIGPAQTAPWVLVVDPIDGTRPAMAGLESACVSIAVASMAGGEPTMADVEVGVVTEIKSGQSFVARRGGGLSPAARLSPNTDPSRMFWTYGFRGRPAAETALVLSELIDGSSVGGGTFDLGSAAFDMTRIVSGQLDAYIEPGPRMIDEVDGMRERFERLGDGEALNNSPYDLAASYLIVTEGGGIVTDAAGRSLGDRPLLGSGHEFQMSCVAAATPELHQAAIAAIDRGLERLADSVG